MPKQIEPLAECRAQALEEALQYCASEPIHRIGKIQGFGVLLAANLKTWRVEFASANLGTLLAHSAETALGAELEAVIGQENAIRLKAIANGKVWTGGRIISLDADQHFDAQIYLVKAHLVIEIELDSGCDGDVFHELFVPIRDALWKLDSESSLHHYAELAVEQIRALTGFDRVMMYKFDELWDGEVIAESKRESCESYLGNHFPASDIPVQARELYVRNLVRVICDIDAEPIEVRSCVGQLDLDMSDSWLRSLSPVHIEYLRNMGVRASLSISLVQNGKLWGLVACHHFAPKRVGLREREMCELVGRIVSLKLINMDASLRDQSSLLIRELLIELTSMVRSTADLNYAVHHLKNKFLELVQASGAVIAINNRFHEIGITPDQEIVTTLLSAFKAMVPTPVFATDNISEALKLPVPSPGLNGISGVMVAPLDHQMHNFIIWFRHSVLRTLRWAGNPQKQLIASETGYRVSPRTSFETWIQTYQDKSPPWTSIERDAASSISLAIIETLAQRALRKSEESYRLLAENSTDLIASLDIEGFFRFASPACMELFGRHCDQIAGLHLGDVIADTKENLQSLLASLRQAGAISTKVFRGLRPDSKEVWIEATLRHTSNASSGHGELLLNARDVTQRYNYQLALEDIHRRNSVILEATGEGLISLDAEGRITYINDVAYKLLRVSGLSLVNTHFCEVFCDGSGCNERSNCPFIMTLDDGETRQGFQVFPKQFGPEKTYLRYVCTPLLENSRLSGCAIVFSETTTQPANDEKIPTEVILETASEAVMLTNMDGLIISVNRAFMEITGYTADEVLGKTPRILRSGVHTPHFYEELWRDIREKGRWAGEIWNRRKNGEIYPQWGSISAILDNEGGIRNYVSVFSDISKAKQAEERLYFIANHDSLTGLPNRTNLSDEINQCLLRCKRSAVGAAVVFIDLDRFKIINDTLGHSAGDEYLKLIASRLLMATRRNDILGRWGGDEFVLVMEAYPTPQLVAETIQRLIQSLSLPAHICGQELIPTASVGVAFYPQDGQRPSELIRSADTAMYSVKQRGGNGFEFYSKDMAKDHADKLRLIVELRHAFEQGQFFLVYQPQISPKDDSLIGVEALARWQHPVRGTLLPGNFLTILEEIGLTREFGRWVLEAACKQMLTWINKELAIPKVSINVAPIQFTDPFIEEVSDIIRSTNIPASMIELEITEGTLTSVESANRVMRGLKNIGVQLAVDDFGTGYSSLSHIKLFPINCFKIDKSFVQELPSSEADAAITNTIIALGESLRVNVIAEGAETEAQRDFLSRAGVTGIQGYVYAKPMRPAELERWLARW